MPDTPKTVLVVDDEPIVLGIARKALERAGFSVVTAENGQSALDLCTGLERSIDLLLTDIKMPRMNGVELARCIADHKPGVPILFMTGNASDSEAKELLTAQPGMDGHATIRKPFKSRDLVERVQGLLQSSE